MLKGGDSLKSEKEIKDIIDYLLKNPIKTGHGSVYVKLDEDRKPVSVEMVTYSTRTSTFSIDIGTEFPQALSLMEDILKRYEDFKGVPGF